MSRKMIIDTDTASDDAVAIVMALQHPEIEVLALTVVSGNVPMQQASINARYSVEQCGKHTPVYEGAAAPLMREITHATFFHGEDGMGNMRYPAPQAAAAPGHAVDALVETIKANPGIILVTLGPMTNVALAVARAPEIVANVERCVVMGGAACTVGNITPAAEFNIWCDPEAARMCFRSGLPIELVGWELCRSEANLTLADIRYCKETIGTPLAHFAIDCNATALKAGREHFGEPGIALPDPVAMAIALDPSICTRQSKHYVEIECEGVYTRGMTVVDQLNVATGTAAHYAIWNPLTQRGAPNTSVCWAIDIPRWKALLFDLLR
ncbi:MAG: nucleoside hydrolase [Kouleothrix sp.]|jgi:purine nucleosidase|nr:nucleoside hydrolase [Kouleothrix sp.]